MIEWSLRPKELSYNINPAFCGEILYYVISEYTKKLNMGFDSIYLPFIFPVIFNSQIAGELKSTNSNFCKILSDNAHLKINFAESTSNYFEVMFETVLFLAKLEVIKFEDNKIYINKKIKKRNLKYLNNDIKFYMSKAKILGKVLANENEPSNLYYLWGIKL